MLMKTTSVFRMICAGLLLSAIFAGAVVAEGIEGVDTTTRKARSILSTADALHVNATGSRNAISTTGTDYASTADEWKTATVQTNATGDVAVYAGPAIVRQIRIRATADDGTGIAATAGVILVKDGTTVKDGAAAAKTASSIIYDGLGGVQFRTNITLNFANVLDNPAASGKVEVIYRPLSAAVIW